jgi:hypothetical protein
MFSHVLVTLLDGQTYQTERYEVFLGHQSSMRTPSLSDRPEPPLRPPYDCTALSLLFA